MSIRELNMNELIKNRFYFVRHGKTDWNDKNLCQGQLDIPLNESGREEIRQLHSAISHLSFSRIVSSPMSRALESAKIIQQYCNKPLEIVDEIKERHWGSLEGISSAEMYRIEEQEEGNVEFFIDNGVESRPLFKQRIIKGFNIIFENEETPLIVSHGRLFLVLSEILQIPLIRQIPNGAIIECIPDQKGWSTKIHGNASR